MANENKQAAAPWAKGSGAAPAAPEQTSVSPAPEAPTVPEVNAAAAPAPAAPEAPSTPAAAPAVSEAAPAAGEGVEMVDVTVPKAYQLRLDHNELVVYKAGIQPMPRSHAEHWYSKANGVSIYKAVA